MMMNAYQEIYTNRVQELLGISFDYAINYCKIESSTFVQLFLVSSVSRKIENGEPNYLSGKSGVELVTEIVKETLNKEITINYTPTLSKSIEYWIGWAVAYYQWYSNRKFCEIFEAVTIEELYIVYFTLHEADINKFVDIIDKRVRCHFKDTNLKRMRTLVGMTQKELAKLSGVGLRSIQMYEQRQKDINKASVESIYRIARILGCSVEDIIEK